MKKLLAIAVAAAITVPMAATADTTVYGKGHVSLDDTNAPGSTLNLVNHSSRIGLKGSNALDNGLTATHKFELGYDIADGGGLTDRDAWIGLKGGFGEVRFGRHTLPSDIVDDAADFMTNGHRLNTAAGRQNNALAYISSFGPVGVAVAHVADGSNTGIDKANDLMVNYATGPLYAGLGYTKVKGLKAGNRVALAYTGANYGVGFVHEKKHGNGAQPKANTLSGKYNFGKAYVAAEYGKSKLSSVTTKSQVLELGYGLGKATKAYVEYSKVGTLKTNRVGLVHAF